MSDRIAFAKRLLAALDTQISDIESRVLAGQCQDHPHYKAELAKRTGLQVARDLVVQGLGQDD